ncbi:FtsX-like permease family protein [bacterium]|nr:FtsX-like permease family protein [bacterium]MBU1983755.1 FtsX-like permease family protein [bacterium]
MKLRTLVWREIFERKNQLVTSFLAILLGITVIISIKNISFYSEKAVAKELDALGANVLILPKSVSMQDYYSADMQSEEIPEEYVDRLTLSDLQGLDNLSPKLSVPVTLGNKLVTLTGILPKDEFSAKAAWQGAGIFSRPENCGTVADIPGLSSSPKETLVRKRVIETLGSDEILVGADIASSLRIREGDQVNLMGRTFTTTAVLPQTGTVDDTRIFAHLHTVQEMTGKGSVVSAIEVVGCCNQISQGLVAKINKLLPDAKVVTITQIVDTQLRTNRTMSRLSMVFLVIIILVGGASIANYMYANVYERRKEIGTLMAMGAGSSLVLRIFLLKALLLGLAAAVGGYILGTAMAIVLGPKIAGVPVLPMLTLILLAVAIAVPLALLASYLPARRAARLDPCTTLQEA